AGCPGVGCSPRGCGGPGRRLRQAGRRRRAPPVLAFSPALPTPRCRPTASSFRDDRVMRLRSVFVSETGSSRASGIAWDNYYAAIEGRSLRPLFREATAYLASAGEGPRVAIDLGCGDGTETLA